MLLAHVSLDVVRPERGVRAQRALVAESAGLGYPCQGSQGTLFSGTLTITTLTLTSLTLTRAYLNLMLLVPVLLHGLPAFFPICFGVYFWDDGTETEHC